MACEHLQAQNMNSSVSNSDPDDAVAKAWGAQLKEMKTEQKVLARKLISDVLFQGCIGSLNRFHVQEFPNFFESRPSTTISNLSTPSPVQFTNALFVSISTSESQESIQEYFSNFE